MTYDLTKHFFCMKLKNNKNGVIFSSICNRQGFIHTSWGVKVSFGALTCKRQQEILLMELLEFPSLFRLYQDPKS